MWDLRAGHEHNFVCGRTFVHHVHLYNRVTGGEFNIELLLGCQQCPTCKRPFEQSNLQHLDPAAEINKALETLKANHEAITQYMNAHNAPMRVGPLAHVVPSSHQKILHEGQNFLIKKRSK